MKEKADLKKEREKFKKEQEKFKKGCAKQTALCEKLRRTLERDVDVRRTEFAEEGKKMSARADQVEKLRKAAKERMQQGKVLTQQLEDEQKEQQSQLVEMEKQLAMEKQELQSRVYDLEDKVGHIRRLHKKVAHEKKAAEELHLTDVEALQREVKKLSRVQQFLKGVDVKVGRQPYHIGRGGGATQRNLEPTS